MCCRLALGRRRAKVIQGSIYGAGLGGGRLVKGMLSGGWGGNDALSPYRICRMPALTSFWILPITIGFFMWSCRAGRGSPQGSRQHQSRADIAGLPPKPRTALPPSA